MNSEQERRAHARYEINQDKFVMFGGGRVLIQDISWGGVSFYAAQDGASESHVQAGDDGAQVAIKVLECIHPPVGFIDPEFPYQLRCQFETGPDDPGLAELMDFVLE